MRSAYFSHFGEVLEPDVPHRELQSIVETLDATPGQAFFPPEGLNWVILGRRDSVEALAGFRRGVDDQAILIVYCQPHWTNLLEWLEAGVVRWPLQFTGPAQMAGSCCAPRYGL